MASNDLRRKNRQAQGILLVFIAAFTFLGMLHLAKLKLTASDNLIAAALLAIVLAISKKYYIRPSAAFFMALVFVPNTLGYLYLYSSPIFDYHWDWIVHLVAAFSFTLAFTMFLMDNKLSKGFIRAAALALFTAITFGAVVEAAEYWGFIFIGFGEGYLGFGDGDTSQNFGPWENSSIDTTLNFAGGLLGIIALIWHYRKKPNDDLDK
jgi:hypothetical protein